MTSERVWDFEVHPQLPAPRVGDQVRFVSTRHIKYFEDRWYTVREVTTTWPNPEPHKRSDIRWWIRVTPPIRCPSASHPEDSWCASIFVTAIERIAPPEVEYL